MRKSVRRTKNTIPERSLGAVVSSLDYEHKQVSIDYPSSTCVNRKGEGGFCSKGFIMKTKEKIDFSGTISINDLIAQNTAKFIKEFNSSKPRPRLRAMGFKVDSKRKTQ